MKDNPIITVEAVKLLIGDIWRQKTDSQFPKKIMIEICEAIDTFQDAPEATEAKIPVFSDELIDFLELKLESEKASFENYEVNSPDDVFDDAEIKELYHKDMKLVNELTILINYINQKNNHEI